MWSKFRFLRWVGRLRPIESGPLRSSAPRRARLRVEGLEDRAVPAALTALDPRIALAAQHDFAGPMARAGYDLAYLYRDFRAFTATSGSPAGAYHSTNPLLQVANGSVIVDALPVGRAAATRADLEALGFQFLAQSTWVVSGYLPIASLGLAAALPSVRALQPAYKGVTSVGAATSQGTHAVQSDVVSKFLGLDGAGVTVGVLSDSYNSLGGAVRDVASGDLPGSGNPLGHATPVDVRADRAGSDEGRAMLQIVHDVAPGAKLSFATTGASQAEFAQNIVKLAAAGANVLVDDYTFLNEPMFQDGLVAHAVDQVYSVGISYFSAAGNLGRASYQQPFINSGVNLGTNGTGLVTTDANFWAHDFDPGPGVNAFQTLTLPPGTSSFSFQWSDPFFSVSGGAGAATNLDLAVFDLAGKFLGMGGFSANIGADPVEVFSLNNPNATPMQVKFAIGKVAGPDPALMKYVAFRPASGGDLTIDEYATASSTTFGHANAAGAETVGAARYSQTPPFGQPAPVLEAYSSRGGTPVLYDAFGNPFAAPQTRQTPDIVGPDGVNTTFFGQPDPLGSGTLEGDGYPNFFGTSAAAPHVAGVAALLLQAKPGLTAARIYSALETTARDMGPAGYDRDSGWGLVQAVPAVVAANGGPYAVTFDGTAGNDTLCVRRDSSGNTLEFLLGGAVQFALPASQVASIAINGLNGNDALTLDYANGAIGKPIAYDGGAGSDSLTIAGPAFPADITAYANIAAIPTVTIASGPTPLFTFTSVESAALTPGNGTVNLLGDNNRIAPQADAFAIRGTGPNAFTATINGVAIQFAGTTALNAYGRQFDDTFDVTPWASNSPAGWGVQTYFDGGSALTQDLLVYRTVAANPVSEDVVVQPAGIGGGEIRVTNAIDASAIAAISYANADLSIVDSDGFSTDTDSLTLRGTSGAEDFLVDLAAAGTSAAPFVDVRAPGGSLTRLRNFSGFATLRIAALGGNDLVRVIAGRSDGAIALNVDLGSAAEGNRLEADGTGGSDVFRYAPGSTPSSGRLELTQSTAAAPTIVDFTGAAAVAFDGDSTAAHGTAGSDRVIVDGTNGPDAFAIAGTGFPSGTVQVNGGPPISYYDLGTTASKLELNGLGGDDRFAIAPLQVRGLASIAIDGGGGADRVEATGTSGDDRYTYTPSTTTLGIESPVGSAMVNYVLANVESIAIDALGHQSGDRLVVTEPLAYTPTPGSGTIPTAPPLAYRNVELFTLDQVPNLGADTASTSEGAAVLVDVLANDTGIGDAPLTLTIATPPSHGTAQVVGGMIRYTPAADYNDNVAGADSFAYRVTDANGDSGTASVTVRISPVNGLPVAAARNVAVAEDSSVAIGLVGADGDPEVAQTLTFAIAAGPSHGSLSGFNPTTGFVTYTPFADYSGPDGFAFVVTDDGTAGGPPLSSNPGTVSVAVTPVNDAPLAFGQSASTDEGAALAIALTGDDGDAGALQSLTFGIVAGPSHGTLAGFNPATGKVTYTPAANYNGPDSFTFAVRDDATAGGPALVSLPATVAIAVAPVNNPPIAFSQSVSVQQNGSAIVALAGDDGDPEANQSLSFAIASGPSSGTLAPLGGGRFLYRPNLAYTGTDSFAFTATDDATAGGAALTSAPATVSLAVTPAPDGIIVTGAGEGGGPHVEVFNAKTGAPRFSFFAYGATFTGGVRVAVGDVNGDGIPDIITGAGVGGFPHVKVFSGKDLALLASFFAFDDAFTGGISVAAGDVDGLPGDEIVVGAGPGAGPHVRTFQIVNGRAVQLAGPLGSFFAFEPTFTGGVNVAVGNYDGVPGDEIVVGAASLGGPHVKVFGSTGAELASFFAFPDSGILGVTVAAADLDGDGKAEIITGPGLGGGPIVRVYRGGTATLASTFPAFNPDYRGGIFVGAADADGDGKADLLIAPGRAARSLQVFDGQSLDLLTQFDAFGSNFLGGVFIAGR